MPLPASVSVIGAENAHVRAPAHGTTLITTTKVVTLTSTVTTHSAASTIEANSTTSVASTPPPTVVGAHHPFDFQLPGEVNPLPPSNVLPPKAVGMSAEDAHVGEANAENAHVGAGGHARIHLVNPLLPSPKAAGLSAEDAHVGVGGAKNTHVSRS
ncbi:MAG: hypothetical protein Q9170_007045 [Blastenia crenularia]